MAVSALLLAHAVPNSLLGPVAGTLADRVDQRLVLVGADIGRAFVFVAIAALLPPFASLIALVVLAAIFESGFRPAGRSVIPALVGPDDLVPANAWLVTALNAGAAVGPLVGGVLVASIGVSGALYVNAVTFVASAAFLVTLPAMRPEPVEGDQLGFIATIREGISFARTDPTMRAIVIGLVLGVAAGGLDNVALVFMATRVFDVGATGYGLLASAFGVGMIAVSLMLVRRNWMSAAGLFALGWFGTAVGNFGVGLAPVVGIAIVAQLIGGAGNGVGLVGGDTLIQQRVPRAMLGRAFGITGSAPFIGMLIAYGAGGFLVDAFGARTTFMISGTATAVIAIGVALMLRKAERAAR